MKKEPTIKTWHIDSSDMLYEWVDKMHEAVLALDKIPKQARPVLKLTLEVIDHE